MEDLYFSVCPVEFDVEELTVGEQKYVDDDQLRSLRSAHQTTHVFRRHNDSIIDIAMKRNASPIGRTTQKLNCAENLAFVAVLIRNSILNHLFAIDRPVFSFHPMRFLATGQRRNLLTNVAPFGVETPEWLAIRPLHYLDVRVFEFRNCAPFVGIATDVRIRRLISLPTSELVSMGLDLTGLYVGVSKQDIDDLRIQPRLELLGRVESVSGRQLQLRDTKTSETSIDSNLAFLEASWKAFDRCVDFVFGNAGPSVRDKLNVHLGELRSGPSKLRQLQGVCSYFEKQELELIEGCRFSVQSLIDSSQNKFPESYQAPSPVFVFNPTLSKTSTDRNRGLSQHGPYSQQTFDKNRPRICVICQVKKKGLVDKFLHKFMNGIPSKGAFQDGFIRKYRLEDPKFTYFTCENSDLASYRKASQEAIKQSTDESEKWDICLVQIDDDFIERDPNQNPYLCVKRIFMSQQVPVQSFKSTTAALADNRLSYALNNIALATYAKLNGIPWLLSADRTIPCELIFGLGSSTIGHSRFGKKERHVGITTVFSGEGNYWISNISPAVSYDDYTTTMIDSLRQTVARVSSELNWQPGDNVRLVFHVFKPLRDDEVSAVKQVMNELGDFDVEYAFIHVVDKHPYLLFDTKQEGKETFFSRQIRGKFAPSRGKFFHVSDFESLLFLTGPDELKRAEDGMPFPVLLRLHRDSTFKDMTYLARQAFAFSSHSWRTFAPCSTPVTVYYSGLIARLLGQLSCLDQWDPDVMLGKIGRTRWFL